MDKTRTYKTRSWKSTGDIGLAKSHHVSPRQYSSALTLSQQESQHVTPPPKADLQSGKSKLQDFFKNNRQRPQGDHLPSLQALYQQQVLYKNKQGRLPLPTTKSETTSSSTPPQPHSSAVHLPLLPSKPDSLLTAASTPKLGSQRMNPPTLLVTNETPQKASTSKLNEKKSMGATTSRQRAASDIQVKKTPLGSKKQAAPLASRPPFSTTPARSRQPSTNPLPATSKTVPSIKQAVSTPQTRGQVKSVKVQEPSFIPNSMPKETMDKIQVESLPQFIPQEPRIVDSEKSSKHASRKKSHKKSKHKKKHSTRKHRRSSSSSSSSSSTTSCSDSSSSNSSDHLKEKQSSKTTMKQSSQTKVGDDAGTNVYVSLELPADLMEKKRHKRKSIKHRKTASSSSSLEYPPNMAFPPISPFYPMYPSFMPFMPYPQPYNYPPPPLHSFNRSKRHSSRRHGSSDSGDRTRRPSVSSIYANRHKRHSYYQDSESSTGNESVTSTSDFDDWDRKASQYYKLKKGRRSYRASRPTSRRAPSVRSARSVSSQRPSFIPRPVRELSSAKSTVSQSMNHDREVPSFVPINTIPDRHASKPIKSTPIPSSLATKKLVSSPAKPTPAPKPSSSTLKKTVSTVKSPTAHARSSSDSKESLKKKPNTLLKSGSVDTLLNSRQTTPKPLTAKKLAPKTLPNKPPSKPTTSLSARIPTAPKPTVKKSTALPSGSHDSLLSPPETPKDGPSLESLESSQGNSLTSIEEKFAQHQQQLKQIEKIASLINISSDSLQNQPLSTNKVAKPMITASPIKTVPKPRVQELVGLAMSSSFQQEPMKQVEPAVNDQLQAIKTMELQRINRLLMERRKSAKILTATTRPKVSVAPQPQHSLDDLKDEEFIETPSSAESSQDSFNNDSAPPKPTVRPKSSKPIKVKSATSSMQASSLSSTNEHSNTVASKPLKADSPPSSQQNSNESSTSDIPSSTTSSPSSLGSLASNDSEESLESESPPPAMASGDFKECPVCSRTFLPDRLDTHLKICSKVSKKANERRVKRERAAKAEEKKKAIEGRNKEPEYHVRGSNWREQHGKLVDEKTNL